MVDIFPTAQASRADSRNNIIIIQEVNSIEIAVLTAVQAGQLTVVISSGTTMTDSVTGIPYYNAWQNVTPNATLSDQMSVIINYFEGLGYVITQLVNAGTNNTFTWNLSW